MSKSLIQSQFGDHAQNYVTSEVHAKGASLARMVELAAPQKDWRVLDIATGAGHTALAFAPLVAHVVASDITEPMLDAARKLSAERGADNVSFANADACDLPFSDNEFDLVTCRIAAHHFPDIPAFLSQCRRVLKPGGVFALVDNIAPDEHVAPDFAADDWRDAALSYNMFEKLRDPSHVKALSLAEWLNLVDRAGLSVSHFERLSKDMQFGQWAARLGAEPTTIDYLKAVLTTAAPALHSFLKPRREEGVLWFSLQEALIIAKSSA